MGYGLGAASAAAFNVPSARRPISIMGDGGFWHNGLASGVGNAVFNKYDGVIIIIDNHYTAATGAQHIPPSPAPTRPRATPPPTHKPLPPPRAPPVRLVHRPYPPPTPPPPPPPPP